MTFDEASRSLAGRSREATLQALRELGGVASRKDIHARALRLGDFTSAEFAMPPPEAVQNKYENAVDHALSWALTNLKRAGLVENPRWSEWRLTSAAHAVPARIAVEGTDWDRVAQLRSMSYREYLRTPEWRRTRAAALARAENHCQMDRTHPGPFEVHHSSYERRGAELESDLVVLCQPCHRRHHHVKSPASHEPRGLWSRITQLFP